jgi:hypothetical protein
MLDDEKYEFDCLLAQAIIGTSLFRPHPMRHLYNRIGSGTNAEKLIQYPARDVLHVSWRSLV